MKHTCRTQAVACVLPLACSVLPAQEPTVDEAREALHKAVHFLREEVSTQGGYMWWVSGDLKLKEGEGKTTGTAIVWVQPPGTPTIGEAFLDAFDAAGDVYYLQAAQDAARVLLSGQLRTGGWYYHTELDPEKRKAYLYRDLPPRETGRPQRTTMLDDDTTQAVVCFLSRLDKTLGFRDDALHEAVGFALDAVLAAQYPNGAWGHNWREYPEPVSPDDYPIIPASYPETWSRTWPNDWTGRYYLNDNITMDTIGMMFAAYDVYGDERYLQSALKGGDFLLLAQMPDPQPAWAQQYDAVMQPAWDRKFEPPAISGRESQDAMRCLLLLYRRTGDRKCLAPIPRALAYLRASQLEDGRLARSYELRTNKPLYFTKDYHLTYDPVECPTHYTFIVEDRLDAIEAEYQRLLTLDPGAVWSPSPDENPQPTAAEIRRIIGAMDDRGAWVQQGPMDQHDLTPESGVISSQAFADHVRALSRYVRAEGTGDRGRAVATPRTRTP